MNPQFQSFGHQGSPVLLVPFPSQGLAENGPTQDGDVCTGWSHPILGAQPRSLVARTCGSSCRDAARGRQAEPWEAADIHRLQVLWLCSVSGPSAPCKLLPLPSKRYLCSEEPKFTSCSLTETSTERQGPGPWPRRASVPPRAREEQQGPAGLSPSVLLQPSRCL